MDCSVTAPKSNYTCDLWLAAGFEFLNKQTLYAGYPNKYWKSFQVQSMHASWNILCQNPSYWESCPTKAALEKMFEYFFQVFCDRRLFCTHSEP